ncbi:MAG: homoserine dehydrogenase [Lachnospiraceae bacterium]|nr:homoserine dehydrogenase [Lachnospiraceae bacterium]
MANIAVLGYGTVGSGVVEVINTNKALIEARVKEEVNVKYVLDLRDFPGDPVEKILVHDFDTILNDKDVDIVVEVLGGATFAYNYVKSALLNGKSVATSNKELVAKYGAELLAIAKEKNVNFFFEASVGGGIPIIRPINECLTADEICEITGILNGTTNYILTKMSKEGLDFGTVLKDAQDKGYAERNPEADVEGYDACRKIAILTSLVTGRQVNFEDIYTEGITSITPSDITLARKLGRSIKLLASSKFVDGKVFSMVSPVMVDADFPLYNVEDVFNAIFVKGNMLGDAMFYGRGAGKLPTASAVVADVVAAIKNRDNHLEVKWDAEKFELSDVSESKKQFFVRIEDTEAGRMEAEKVFGVDEFITDESVKGECAFVTAIMTEAEFAKKEAMLTAIRNRIRMN